MKKRRKLRKEDKRYTNPSGDTCKSAAQAVHAIRFSTDAGGEERAVRTGTVVRPSPDDVELKINIQH